MVLIWWYVSDFFGFIYEMLSSVIDWIVSVISLLTFCVSFLFKLVDVLPSAFTISLFALISISVVYKLLGREAGN